MIKTLLLVLAFLIITSSIKFSYILHQRQMQCFHQPAQKGIRYQIDIKANSSFYGIQVNEHSAVHYDSRTDEEYKYFSAFAISDAGITFCVNSLTDDPVQMHIEFYHGFYLETLQSSKDSNQFLSMTRRMQEISDFIKMNYQKYKHQILERQPINNRLEIYSTFAIIIFLLIVTGVKFVYLIKAKKFMKARKII